MIISNTTPMINFCAIKRLDILEKLFNKIVIPRAVHIELNEKLDSFPWLTDVHRTNFVEVSKIQDIKFYNLLKADLDEGEAEVITLAFETNAKLLLLDEIAARNIAQIHNLPFIGSIGCLLLAKKKRIVKTIHPLLDDMQYKANFWISPKLYEKILIESGEASQ